MCKFWRSYLELAVIFTHMAKLDLDNKESLMSHVIFTGSAFECFLIKTVQKIKRNSNSCVSTRAFIQWGLKYISLFLRNILRSEEEPLSELKMN